MFSLEIPYGVDVVDRRLGYAYHKDPWWPEAGAMLREKFGWPKPDLSPLRNLGTPADKKLDGQPAPPLRVAKWLNSQPLELAALRGKVVLLEFWNSSAPFRRELVPALRQIYATYHPAGLEMIAIHTPTDQPEEVRRFVREFGIEYPVAIDAPGRGPSGATAEAYGSQDWTCAFLIDPEGKVHSVGSQMANGGRIVETLIPLLRKAGAGDAKPISVETPRLPDDAYKALELLFQSKAKEALDADPQGRITGRIVDGHGQPLAGATVRATLQLTVLSLSSPGANRITAYRGPADRFTAEAGPDGRFELSSLCKGEYSIKAEAPGRAWVERKFVIAPDFNSAPLEIVLDQGGEFSGQVRDEDGPTGRGSDNHADGATRARRLPPLHEFRQYLARPGHDGCHGAVPLHGTSGRALHDRGQGRRLQGRESGKDTGRHRERRREAQAGQVTREINAAVHIVIHRGREAADPIGVRHGPGRGNLECGSGVRRWRQHAKSTAMTAIATRMAPIVNRRWAIR